MSAFSLLTSDKNAGDPNDIDLKALKSTTGMILNITTDLFKKIEYSHPLLLSLDFLVAPLASYVSSVDVMKEFRPNIQEVVTNLLDATKLYTNGRFDEELLQSTY